MGRRSYFYLHAVRAAEELSLREVPRGHGEMGNYDMSYFFVDPPRKVTIENIKQVGNHAIRIYWNDGHSDGMYQWEMLRQLCPCGECYPEQE